ncbi:MAG: hypothetical protein ACKO04_05865, partial [Actinomycetes bacterium]
EEFPDRHCQDDFFGSGDDELRVEDLEVAGRRVRVCATTQDLVGWALALDGRVQGVEVGTVVSVGPDGVPVVREGAFIAVEGADGPEHYAPLAAELLGLSEGDAGLLFYLGQDAVRDWPGLVRTVAAGTSVGDAVAAYRAAP